MTALRAAYTIQVLFLVAAFVFGIYAAATGLSDDVIAGVVQIGSIISVIPCVFLIKADAKGKGLEPYHAAWGLLGLIGVLVYDYGFSRKISKEVKPKDEYHEKMHAFLKKNLTEENKDTLEKKLIKKGHKPFVVKSIINDLMKSIEEEKTPETTSSAAIAALVLGISALLLIWLPLIGMILFILAIVFGIIGINKTKHHAMKGKGMAIAGLVMGCIPAALFIVAFTIGFISGMMGYYGYQDNQDIQVVDPADQDRSQPRLLSGTVALQPLAEYDGLSKETIMNQRKAILEEYNISYEPRDMIWQIEDGKPWWGVEGQFCEGDGEVSIKGPSEESRFINNPLLLLGIDEGTAYIMGPTCFPVYPQPVLLNFSEERGVVVYNLTHYKKQKAQIPIGSKLYDPDNLKFDVIGLNARDLGYDYTHASFSEGVRDAPEGKLSKEVVRFRDYIHLGGSCGHPEKCNNMSPYQPEKVFIVSALPSKATFKLWGDLPDSPSAEPDFIFVIKFV